MCYFTAIIALICIIAFCIYNVNVQPDDAQKVLIDSPWIYTGQQNWMEPWRFFTYSFLHSDAMHLVQNMMIFLLVCPFLELAHDSFRPATIYIVGCVLGSMLSGIVAPGIPLYGASGGCFALVLAHIANIIINGDIMNKKVMVLRLVVLTPMVVSCLFDVCYAVERWNYEGYNGDGISYTAHAAGAFTGLFFGTFTLRNYEKETWENFTKWVFVGLYIAAFGTVTVLSIFDVT